MQVEYSSKFIKMVQSLPRQEQVLLSKKIEIFRANPFGSNLKTHQLTGKLKDFYSFSLTFSKRVLFIKNNDKIIFIAVGSHDQVYR